MREMPGFSGLASADFEGVFAHSYKRCRPRLFFGEPWRGQTRRCSGAAARPANARGELIRSRTVRSWRRGIRLCGRFPYRPTIGGACGMYRPPIGPVSAIERAIVCMQKYPCTRRRHAIVSADFEGFLHTATSGAAPGFFYARSWMWRRPALGPFVSCQIRCCPL